MAWYGKRICVFGRPALAAAIFFCHTLGVICLPVGWQVFFSGYQEGKIIFFSSLEVWDQLTRRKMVFLLSPVAKSYFFTVCPHGVWRRKPYICSSFGFSAVYLTLLVSVCLQWEVDKRENTQCGWLARRNVSTSSGKAGSRPWVRRARRLWWLWSWMRRGVPR